jgi:hypothetical protein
MKFEFQNPEVAFKKAPTPIGRAVAEPWPSRGRAGAKPRPSRGIVGWRAAGHGFGG